MRTLEMILNGEDKTIFLLKCSMDFKFFGERVLGLTIEPQHERWVKMVENNKRVLIISFTGSGKTEIMANAYPLWKIFKTQGWQALITSKSLKQSQSVLERIKSTISENELLKDLIPRKDVWNRAELNTKNKCKIFCVPYSENVKGYAVNYVLADEASSYVDKSIYYRFVETRVNAKNGTVCLITTPQHPSDLSQELLDNPYYATEVFKILDEDGMPTTVRFPMSRIEEIKRGDSLAFKKEYMCDVSVLLDAPFDPNDVTNCFNNNLKFTMDHREIKGDIYSGHDFAVSKLGDYSVDVFIDKVGEDYIIRYMERKRGVSIPQQEVRLIELFNIMHPVNMLMDESNMGQGILQTMRDKGLPASGQVFSPAKRHQLLINLKRVIETGHLVIPYSDDISTRDIIDTLVKELTSFKSTTTKTGQQTLVAQSAHDDCVMALAMGIQAASDSQEFIDYIATEYKEVDKKYNLIAS